MALAVEAPLNNNSRSFVTKSVPGISREPFDQILQGHPYRPALQPHQIYTITNFFQSKVIAENCRKYRLGQFRVEFLQNGLSKDQEILHTYQEQLAMDKPVRYDVTSCKMQLNTAQSE